MLARSSKFSLLGLGATLVLAWVCYQQAFSGPLQLDDSANLSGLETIEDFDSALNFIFSGGAGPLGRPISLATFALQAEHWGQPQAVAAFLRVNLLVHLTNALLLALAFFQLSRMRSVEHEKAILIACAASSMWVVMPLLATATLLVIQRMTTFAALFSLLGIVFYLAARRRLINGSVMSGLTGMSASVGIGTVLGAFAKESALLLPTLILVLEFTLLERPKSVDTRLWRVWHALFLVLPTVLIIGYLASRAAYPEWVVARRDFNAWERLLTEARLLWLYLSKALAGIPGNLGIYQSATVVSRSILEPPAFLAFFSWLGLFVAAVVWRRRYPLFAFAALWYLAGHLIESTVIPLELYFEHRNYLAIAGPLFAVCCALILGREQIRRMASLVLPAYVLLSAWFLFFFASMWGEPAVASRFWVTKYPDSVRAATNYATYQLAIEGPARTVEILGQFARENPAYAYLRIQELNIGCILGIEQDEEEIITYLHNELPTVDFNYSIWAMLPQLLTTVANSDCEGVDTDTVEAFAVKLYENTRYLKDPVYNSLHYKLLAMIASHREDYELAVLHIGKAIEHSPAIALNAMMVRMLLETRGVGAAQEFVDSIAENPPRNPLRRLPWRRSLLALQNHVNETARTASENTESQLDAFAE